MAITIETTYEGPCGLSGCRSKRTHKHTLIKCNMCGEMKINVENVPSRSQLLFGGWHIKMENRCPSCEAKLVRKIDKMFKNDFKDFYSIFC